MTARAIICCLALFSIVGNALPANASALGGLRFGEASLGRDFSRQASSPVIEWQLVTEDEIFNSAYYDTLAILKTRNRCSEFFGGSFSVAAFKQLAANMRKDYFDPKIGIRMWGTTINVIYTPTNRGYRLFEKMDLNGNGPFYRSNDDSELPLPGVGTYQPATREVRVLMLLHELGHAVKADDGNWLLPNDGNNEELSRRNSLTVEKVCGEEIANLIAADNQTEMMAARAKRPSPTQK